MVRNFPTTNTPINNPLLSHTFIFAFILSTIGIISLLCAKTKRKRPPPRTRARKPDETTELLPPATNHRPNEAAPPPKVEDKIGDPPPLEPPTPVLKELPPPPRLASIRASSYHVGSSSNAAHGAKLTSSMSMRLSGRLKGLKKGSKKEHDNDKDKENDKLQREDSVWKKTIILGEKCRVPDEDEDDIIYDENGNRITTFHRKQSCSSMSRQSSDAHNQQQRF